MTVPDLPSGLRERGHRLWSGALAKKPTMGVADLVLLEEACRLADRLDMLAGLIDGDEAVWARIKDPDRGGDIELVIDSALSSARLHASTLAGLVKQLDLPESAAVPVAGDGPPTLAALRGGKA